MSSILDKPKAGLVNVTDKPGADPADHEILESTMEIRKALSGFLTFLEEKTRNIGTIHKVLSEQAVV